MPNGVEAKSFPLPPFFIADCNVRVVARGTDEWSAIMSLFEKKFGKVFASIKDLGDFTLFDLHPANGGRYVEGFGRAFQVNAAFTASEHVVGAGHAPK